MSVSNPRSATKQPLADQGSTRRACLASRPNRRMLEQRNNEWVPVIEYSQSAASAESLAGAHGY